MARERFVKQVLISVALLLCLYSALFAQATTQVSGIVTDPTGAVIPNAALELINNDTGVQRETRSDTQGRYSFTQLQPGTYRLVAKAAGFSDVTIQNIRLLVNTPAAGGFEIRHELSPGGRPVDGHDQCRSVDQPGAEDRVF